MKKFKFAITDNTSYTGEDSLAFYSKALLESGSRSTFRVVPGIKSKAKLPRYDAGDIIKDAGCSWSPSGEGTLSQKSVEVCAKDIQLELCATTFENNFLGELLRPGHNSGEVTPEVFLDYVAEQVAKKVQNDLEYATWMGDPDDDGLSYPYTICEGLIPKMKEDGNVLTVDNTTVDSSNVMAELLKIYNKIPDTLLVNPNTVIYVADNIYRAFQTAVAAQSAEAYYVGDREANFLGIPLIRAVGMDDDYAVAASTDNLVLLTDLLSDEEELNFLPQSKVTGTRTIRIVGGFKFGVDYLISEEVVLYRPAATS